MISFLKIKSVLLYKLNIFDFKKNFRPCFNLQKVKYNLFNKYIIYKVNKIPSNKY